MKMELREIQEINWHLAHLLKQHHVPSPSELKVWQENRDRVSEYVQMRIMAERGEKIISSNRFRAWRR